MQEKVYFEKWEDIYRRIKNSIDDYRPIDTNQPIFQIVKIEGEQTTKDAFFQTNLTWCHYLDVDKRVDKVKTAIEKEGVCRIGTGHFNYWDEFRAVCDDERKGPYVTLSRIWKVRDDFENVIATLIVAIDKSMERFLRHSCIETRNMMDQAFTLAKDKLAETNNHYYYHDRMTEVLPDFDSGMEKTTLPDCEYVYEFVAALYKIIDKIFLRYRFLEFKMVKPPKEEIPDMVA